MADKKTKIDIKQASYDLADEIEKECGGWENLPEDEKLKKCIISDIIKREHIKKKQKKK